MHGTAHSFTYLRIHVNDVGLLFDTQLPYCLQCSEYIDDFLDPSRVSCSGFLDKRKETGGVNLRAWRKRWFVLCGHHLAYYTDPEVIYKCIAPDNSIFHTHTEANAQQEHTNIAQFQKEKWIGY